MVIVDDVVTSGGSIKAFQKELKGLRAKVKGLARYDGDTRLQVDSKTKDKLTAALKKKGIKVNVNKLTDSLTRTEAGGIIRSINGIKGQNARDEFTKKLRGLFN